MKHVTLLFLLKEGHILLAMKKRSHGQGKWNGVGGKLDEGETPEQAAVRECQEEIEVTPKHLKKVGELHFFDQPDTEHYCHIYTAAEWDGEPSETEEMRPEWFNVDEIPYDTMWPDDRFWLPKMLAGKTFTGTVVISPDDKILRCDIQETN